MDLFFRAKSVFKVVPWRIILFVVGALSVVGIISIPTGVFAEPPIYGVQQVNANDRGRPSIVNNSLVTDTGVPLRGENPRATDTVRNDPNFWVDLRDNYHLNTVRVLVYREPQNYSGGCGMDCDLPTVQQIIPHLDEWVERGSEQGFYVIIDYHPVGGRDETDAIDWWSQIAPRYKDRTHVIYEVTNEPGGAGYPLAEYMERMRGRIRADAPDTMMILWSIENARDDNIDAILQYTPTSIHADWTKAIIGIHMYWDYNFSKVQQLKNAYPLMNTEIGGWTESEYMNVTDDVESLGMSWIWLDGATEERIPPSSVYWAKDPYFNGSTLVPTATPSPTPLPTGTPPASDITNLPGHIETENYKNGGEGVAYHDTTPGNTGNIYRTDDVDIQIVQEGNAGEYNIGWTATGEWLAYDVNVTETGFYDIVANVASGATGTKTLHVEIDGNNVSGAMNYTGSAGWQTWTNLTAVGINLSAGTHQPKIVFDTPSLNLNSIDVVPSLSDPSSGGEFKIFLPLVIR